jgi:hypothetical protein
MTEAWALAVRLEWIWKSLIVKINLVMKGYCGFMEVGDARPFFTRLSGGRQA